MPVSSEFLQLAGIVFSAGIVWERLNALNKKVAALNDKTVEALINIAKLDVIANDNTRHIQNISSDFDKHVEWANATKTKIDEQIAGVV